jgi:group I intron endonuclease
MKTSGIYSITNKVNHKSYWGSSKDINYRWNHHKNSLRRNKHENPRLQRAWNKYGEGNFEFKLEEESSLEKLQETEQCYLDWIFTFPKQWFYNIGRNVESWNRGTRGLQKHTDESKRKLSISLTGIRRTVETKKKMSISLIGNTHFLNHKHTKETLDKMSSNRRKNENFIKDHNIYMFKNRVTGEMFVGCRREFYNKYNFHKDRCNISSLIKGRTKSHKNWIFVSKQENKSICS